MRQYKQYSIGILRGIVSCAYKEDSDIGFQGVLFVKRDN